MFVGAEGGENGFPRECQVCREPGRDPSMMQFLVVLAHEVAHNELDQRLARSYK